MKQNFEISHQQPLGYTVKDAMRLSHLGKTKFYALIKAGTIRTRRIGRNHFIPREELERLLALPEEAARYADGALSGRLKD